MININDYSIVNQFRVDFFESFGHKFYLSLHTDSPEKEGYQSTNELKVRGYKRLSMTLEDNNIVMNEGCLDIKGTHIVLRELMGLIGFKQFIIVLYYGIGTKKTGKGELIMFNEINV